MQKYCYLPLESCASAFGVWWAIHSGVALGLVAANLYQRGVQFVSLIGSVGKGERGYHDALGTRIRL